MSVRSITQHTKSKLICWMRRSHSPNLRSTILRLKNGILKRRASAAAALGAAQC